MSAYQNTIVLLDDTKEAELNEHVEAVMTVQDVADSFPIEDATVRDGFQGGTAETITKPSRDHRQLIYPAWPTSTPGPQATLPPSGLKLYPTRTDQMMYEGTYDQERGRPGVSLPVPMISKQTAPESRGLTKRAAQLDPFRDVGHA